ncbi:MAG: hypothetical protein EXS63_09745, partial [Candidatus Omnitrophica bacterium]|nr:hypothetical protein [Candidatus Omnitrophota bacterium]
MGLRILSTLIILTLAIPQPLQANSLTVHKKDEIASGIKRPRNDVIASEAKQSQSISIPPDLGTIDEVFSSRNTNDEIRKTIIYIQDAHDSLEAQENIARIIQRCVKNYGVKTVFEEGYEGPVPSDDYFGFIKDPAVKEKVAYFLMDHLRIGGAEYAHINRKQIAASPSAPRNDVIASEAKQSQGLDFQLIGADSLALHLENIRQYQRSALNKAETEKELTVLSTEIEKLANQYFPKDFKEWLKLKERFEEHKVGLGEYLKRMSPQSTVHSPQTKKELNRGLLTVDRGQKYPTLSLLLQSRKFQEPSLPDQINPKTLLEELSHLENDISKQFLQTERNKKIFEYSSGLKYFKKLNEMAITPAEFETVKEQIKKINTREMAQFIAKESRQSIAVSRKWEENIQDAIRFYEISLEREKAIERQLSAFSYQSSDKTKRDGNDLLLKADSGKLTAVLVFGGFHKNGIKEILKRNGYSYVIVSPKITKIDKKHQEDYKRLMSVGFHAFEAPLNLARASRPASIPFVLGRTPMGDKLARAELRTIAKIATENPQLSTTLLDRKMEGILLRSRSELRMDELSRNTEWIPVTADRVDFQAGDLVQHPAFGAGLCVRKKGGNVEFRFLEKRKPKNRIFKIDAIKKMIEQGAVFQVLPAVHPKQTPAQRLSEHGAETATTVSTIPDFDINQQDLVQRKTLRTQSKNFIREGKGRGESMEDNLRKYSATAQMPAQTQGDILGIYKAYPEAFDEGRIAIDEAAEILVAQESERRSKVDAYLAAKSGEGIHDWDEVLWVMDRYAELFDVIYLDFDNTLFHSTVYRGSDQWFRETLTYFGDWNWQLNAMKASYERMLLKRGLLQPMHPQLIPVLKRMLIKNKHLRVRGLTSRKGIIEEHTNELLHSLGFEHSRIETIYGQRGGFKFRSIKKEKEAAPPSSGIQLFVDDQMAVYHEVGAVKKLPVKGLTLLGFYGAAWFKLETEFQSFLTHLFQPASSVEPKLGVPLIADLFIDAMLLSRLSNDGPQRSSIYLAPEVLNYVQVSGDEEKMAYLEAVADFLSRSLDQLMEPALRLELLKIFYGMIGPDRDLWAQAHLDGKLNFEKIDRTLEAFRGRGNYKLIFNEKNLYFFMEPLLDYLVRERPDVLVLPDMGARPFDALLRFFIEQEKLPTRIVNFPISVANARDTMYELTRWERLVKGQLSPADGEDSETIEFLKAQGLLDIPRSARVLIFDDTMSSGYTGEIIKAFFREQFGAQMIGMFTGFDYRTTPHSYPVNSAIRVHGRYRWRISMNEELLPPGIISLPIWEMRPEKDIYTGSQGRISFETPRIKAPTSICEKNRQEVTRVQKEMFENFKRDYGSFFHRSGRPQADLENKGLVAEERVRTAPALAIHPEWPARIESDNGLALFRHEGGWPSWVDGDHALSENDLHLLTSKPNGTSVYFIHKSGSELGFVILRKVLDEQQRTCIVIEKIQPSMQHDADLSPVAVVEAVKGFVKAASDVQALYIQAEPKVMRDISESHRVRRRIKGAYENMPSVAKSWNGHLYSGGRVQIGTIQLLWQRLSTDQEADFRQASESIRAITASTTGDKAPFRKFIQTTFGTELTRLQTLIDNHLPISHEDVALLSELVKRMEIAQPFPLRIDGVLNSRNINPVLAAQIQLRCHVELTLIRDYQKKPDFDRIYSHLRLGVVTGGRAQRMANVIQFFFNHLWVKGWDVAKITGVEIQKEFERWGLLGLYAELSTKSVKRRRFAKGGNKSSLMEYLSPGSYKRMGKYFNLSAPVLARDHFLRYLSGEWYAVPDGTQYTITGDEVLPTDALVTPPMPLGENPFGSWKEKQVLFHATAEGVVGNIMNENSGILATLSLKEGRLHVRWNANDHVSQTEKMPDADQGTGKKVRRAEMRNANGAEVEKLSAEGRIRSMLFGEKSEKVSEPLKPLDLSTSHSAEARAELRTKTGIKLTPAEKKQRHLELLAWMQEVLRTGDAKTLDLDVSDWLVSLGRGHLQQTTLLPDGVQLNKQLSIGAVEKLSWIKLRKIEKREGRLYLSFEYQGLDGREGSTVIYWDEGKDKTTYQVLGERKMAEFYWLMQEV